MGRLIDADRLLEILEREEAYHSDFPQRADGVRDAIMDVISAPTVDAVPVVTGTWKAVTDDGENYKRICTRCGKEAPFDELEGVYLIYPHCPWCGAKMGVGRERWED